MLRTATPASTSTLMADNALPPVASMGSSRNTWCSAMSFGSFLYRNTAGCARARGVSACRARGAASCLVRLGLVALNEHLADLDVAHHRTVLEMSRVPFTRQCAANVYRSDSSMTSPERTMDTPQIGLAYSSPRKADFVGVMIRYAVGVNTVRCWP